MTPIRLLLKSNTAIIIFTRTANDEALHKHFVGSGNIKANRIIANSLIQHTVDTVRKTGIPYFVVYSNQQQGSTFGDRLNKAMLDVFSCGFENVIAIGNDCPELDPKLLLEAERALACSEVVLGPATDGGVYLVGVSSKAFAENLLHAAEWESKNMFASLIKYLHSHDTLFYCLESKQDIDNSTDVAVYLLKCRPLCQFEAMVRSVLASVNKSLLTYHFSYLSFISKSRFSLRAPPAIL